MAEEKTKERKNINSPEMDKDKSSQSSEKKEDTKKNNKLTAVIRISGMVKVNKDIKNTLDRLRLRRKYSCVLVNSGNKAVSGMLKKIKHYIAYGSIDEKTLEKLIEERGKSVEGNKQKVKVDVEKVVKGLIQGRRLDDFELKGFFRLHPPRKGIKSKLQYPKGVLGDNGPKINELIERML